MFSSRDIFWMQHAIRLAEYAANNQEVPVGAVLVHDDTILGEGWNRSIGDCDPSAHAEIIALRSGAKICHNYRLLHSTLYTTLEPCMMCVGAMVHARVARVVFGAYDAKAGAVESVVQLGQAHSFNHRVYYQGGLLQESCALLLTQFFRSKRHKNILINSRVE